jgi:hypothetical protein
LNPSPPLFANKPGEAGYNCFGTELGEIGKICNSYEMLKFIKNNNVFVIHDALEDMNGVC